MLDTPNSPSLGRRTSFASATSWTARRCGSSQRLWARRTWASASSWWSSSWRLRGIVARRRTITPCSPSRRGSHTMLSPGTMFENLSSLHSGTHEVCSLCTWGTVNFTFSVWERKDRMKTNVIAKPGWLSRLGLLCFDDPDPEFRYKCFIPIRTETSEAGHMFCFILYLIRPFKGSWGRGVGVGKWSVCQISMCLLRSWSAEPKVRISSLFFSYIEAVNEVPV